MRSESNPRDRDEAPSEPRSAGSAGAREADLNALLAQERAGRARAEAGNRSRDEFLALLAHELRTPLNAVYGWARMMQTARLDGEASVRALDAIVRNANAQVRLIDDLLDVSLVVNGKMRLDVRLLDVTTVIEAALEAVYPAALAKDIRLEARLDPRGAMVVGDPGRLQQVVWNLVMNAVKFTPAGGLVQVQLRRSGGRVEIVVSDTGQGIPPHVLPFVFDRFREWDRSSSRPQRGLGLGLALVKLLTERHRGTVSAESAGDGRGARFKVTLPFAIASRRVQDPPVTRVEPAPRPPVRLDALRVLAVNRDPDALALTAAILDDAGALTRTCRSPGDAMSVLRYWRPDVLVSDLGMRGDDGYALIRRVRALDRERGVRTPAVALTADGREDDRVRALSFGYDICVSEPVDPDELTTIIGSVARVLGPSPRAGRAVSAAAFSLTLGGSGI